MEDRLLHLYPPNFKIQIKNGLWKADANLKDRCERLVLADRIDRRYFIKGRTKILEFRSYDEAVINGLRTDQCSLKRRDPPILAYMGRRVEQDFNDDRRLDLTPALLEKPPIEGKRARENDARMRYGIITQQPGRRLEAKLLV